MKFKKGDIITRNDESVFVRIKDIITQDNYYVPNKYYVVESLNGTIVKSILVSTIDTTCKLSVKHHRTKQLKKILIN